MFLLLLLLVVFLLAGGRSGQQPATILYSDNQLLSAVVGDRASTSVYCSQQGLFQMMGCTSAVALINYRESLLNEFPVLYGVNDSLPVMGPLGTTIAENFTMLINGSPWITTAEAANITTNKFWMGVQYRCLEWTDNTQCQNGGTYFSDATIFQENLAGCGTLKSLVCLGIGCTPIGTPGPTTEQPSSAPTISMPTVSPTKFPSASPSRTPSEAPITSRPSKNPITSMPSANPSTSRPSKTPSHSPITSSPSLAPTVAPTWGWLMPATILTGSGELGAGAAGASIAINDQGNFIAFGSPNQDINGGASFVYKNVAGTWTQVGEYGGNAVGGTSHQGSSVALSSDGTTFAFGGYGDDYQAGAVWIFIASGGTYVQQAKLVGNSVITAALQGETVALSADGNTVAIGGPSDNSGVGAVWIFVRSGTTWSQQAKLVGTGYTIGSSNVFMGRALSISADGNTVAIGGPDDNSLVGSTWIWVRSGTSWSQQARLVGTGAVSSAQLQGYSVSLSGTGNTLVIGAPDDTAAYVWTRSGGVWTQQIRIYMSSISEFGIAVSLSRDGDVLSVGSNGGVFMYRFIGGLWRSQGAELVTSGASGQGQPVACSHDGNIVITGATAYSSGLGGVLVYTTGMTSVPTGSPSTSPSTSKPSTSPSTSIPSKTPSTSHPSRTPSQSPSTSRPSKNPSKSPSTSHPSASPTTSRPSRTPSKTPSSSPSTSKPSASPSTSRPSKTPSQAPTVPPTWGYTELGPAYAFTAGSYIVSDIDAYGKTIVIGNRDLDSVYVFSNSSGTIFSLIATFTNSSSDGLGTAVAISGDGTVIVAGTPTDNGFVGAIFTWNWNGSAWVPRGTKIVVSHFNGALSISNDGTVLTVGTPGTTPAGATLIYRWISGAWSAPVSLIPPTSATDPEFGYSVAVSADGKTVVFGAIDDNRCGGSGGSVSGYSYNGTNWNARGSPFCASDQIGSAEEGYSIAISGDGNTFIFGGPNDNAGIGAAWIYNWNGTAWLETIKLIPTLPYSGEPGYGSVVAMSDDGKVAAMCSLTDVSNIQTCDTYRLDSSTGPWRIQSKITPLGYYIENGGLTVSLTHDGELLVYSFETCDAVPGEGGFLVFSTGMTSTPTTSPSATPTVSHPSVSPSTSKPSKSPSKTPSRTPSKTPSTSKPSTSPSTSKPSTSPTTSKPSTSPTKAPTITTGYSIVTGTGSHSATSGTQLLYTWGTAVGSYTYSSPSITCPNTGIFLFSYQIGFAGNTVGNRLISGVLSSYGNYISSVQVASSQGGDTGIGASEIISCTAGNTVEMFGYQSSGGPLNIISGDSPTRMSLVQLDSSRPHGLTHGNAAAQSIPTGVETLLTTYWNTPTVTTGITWNGAGLYTVTNAGLYLITFSMCFAANGAGTRRYAYLSTSIGGLYAMETTQSPDDRTCLATTALVMMSAGETAGVKVYQDVPSTAINTDTGINQAFTIIQLDNTEPNGVVLGSNTQSATAGAVVTLTNACWATPTLGGGVTLSAGGLFTASVGGVYIVTAVVGFAFGSGGVRQAYIFQTSNPSFPVAFGAYTPTTTSGQETSFSMQATVTLAAGESVYVQVYQTSSTSPLNVCGTAFSTFGMAKVTFTTPAPTTNAPTNSPTTSKPSTSPSTSKPTTSPSTSKPSRTPSKTPTTSKPSISPNYYDTYYGIAAGSAPTSQPNANTAVLSSIFTSNIGTISYSSGALTSPFSTIYVACYQVEYTASTSGNRAIWATFAPSATTTTMVEMPASQTGVTGIGACEIISFTSGNTLSVTGYQTAGSLPMISTDSPARFGIVELNSAKAYGIVRVASSQTFSTSPVTFTNWGTATTTTGVSFNGPTGTYTLTNAGPYLVTIGGCFASASSGYRYIQLIKSGTALTFQSSQPSVSDRTCLATTAIIIAAASDTLSVLGFQSTGSSLATDQSFPPSFTVMQLDSSLSYGSVLMTTGQSITNGGSAQTLTSCWGTASTGGGMTFSNIAGAFTASVPGTYLVTLNIVFPGTSTTGERRAYIFQSSTAAFPIAFTDIYPSQSSSNSGLSTQAIIVLAAGETVWAQVYQSSGISLTLVTGLGLFSIARMRV